MAIGHCNLHSRAPSSYRRCCLKYHFIKRPFPLKTYRSPPQSLPNEIKMANVSRLQVPETDHPVIARTRFQLPTYVVITEAEIPTLQFHRQRPAVEPTVITVHATLSPNAGQFDDPGSVDALERAGEHRRMMLRVCQHCFQLFFSPTTARRHGNRHDHVWKCTDCGQHFDD